MPGLKVQCFGCQGVGLGFASKGFRASAILKVPLSGRSRFHASRQRPVTPTLNLQPWTATSHQTFSSACPKSFLYPRALVTFGNGIPGSSATDALPYALSRGRKAVADASVLAKLLAAGVWGPRRAPMLECMSKLETVILSYMLGISRLY